MRAKTPLLSNICAVLINILDTEGNPIRLLVPIRIPVIIESTESGHQAHQNLLQFAPATAKLSTKPQPNFGCVLYPSES